jgi:heme-degrading monooxygenase HmoA
MFARVTILQLQPGKLDEFLRIFQDSIAPAAAAQPGFGGITVLTDPRIDKVLAVGLWETEDDLLAGETAYYQERLAGIKSLLAAPPVREVYEASVQVELTAQGSARIRGI